MSFFNELKRRNVFKVAASYAIVSWIVLQVADTTFPALNIPAWVMSLIAILVLLGFPIAMFLAWAFEMTPDGIKPTAEVPVENSIRAQTGQKMNYLVIGGLVVLLLVVMLDSYVLQEESAAQIPANDGGDAAINGGLIVTAEEELLTPGTTAGVSVRTPDVAPLAVDIPRLSVAVLPFANLSSDPEQEYFADGLTEELLNKLAQVQDLQVAARTSSFYFKGRNAELRAVGEALGVAHVLEGSVRKAGTQLRITAQLVNAATGFHLWSDSFDRDLTDIFAVQDEIAQAVTTALSVSLGAGEFDRPGMTRNPEAYDAWLKAEAEIRTNGVTAFNVALEHLQRAVALDPQFGLGWLRLSIVYDGAIDNLPAEQTRDFLALRNAALEQAKATAPSMPELLLADAFSNRERGNWLAAEAIYQQLLQKSENSAGVDAGYGYLLMAAGRGEDALPYLQRAKRLDPLSSNTSRMLATVLLMQGRTEEAIIEADRGKALGNATANMYLGTIKMLAAYETDDLLQAATFVRQEGAPLGQLFIDVADALAEGDNERVLAAIRAVLERDVSPITSTALIVPAAMAGDPQLAFRLLVGQDNIGDARTLGIFNVWIGKMSAVRQLPEFRQLVTDAGLLDYWRATGEWSDFCRPVNDDFECF